MSIRNLVYVLFLLVGILAFQSQDISAATKQKQAEKSENAPTTKLTRVEPIKVCMVNDSVFGDVASNKLKDQIPVPVGKTTYYGCCQHCVKTLNENESSRTAVDPISGEKVDKAKAVIGARSDGSVLYFKNEANLKSYSN